MDLRCGGANDDNAAMLMTMMIDDGRAAMPYAGRAYNDGVTFNLRPLISTSADDGTLALAR